MEVCCVVPNVKLVTNLAPTDDIIVESLALGALFVIDGVRKAAVDGAEANANVVTGLCNFGSFLCVLICECVNRQVGVILFQILGNRVDKAEERACGAAFFFFNLFAVGAFAMSLKIVLRNRYDVCIRVFGKRFANVFDDFFQNFGVGHARVGAVGRVGIGRFAQGVDGVHKQSAVVEALTAKLLGKRSIAVVNTVLNTPIRIANAKPSQAACLHGGGVFHQNAFAYLNITGGANLKSGGKEANARILFEKGVNAVKHTGVVAFNGQATLGRFNFITVLFKRGVHRNKNGKSILADVNTFLLQIFCQLFCGVERRRFVTRGNVYTRQCLLHCFSSLCGNAPLDQFP